MATETIEATTGGMPGEGGMPEQAAAQQTQQDGTGERPGDGGKPPQAEDTTALRESLRKEREARSTAEKRLKAIEDKDLPEAERVKRERDEVSRDRDNWRTKAHKANVALEAASLGFANPRLAYAALVEFDMIELDRDGIPTGVESALKKLLRENPGLASTASRASGEADQGAKGGARKTGTFNDTIREAFGRGR